MLFRSKHWDVESGLASVPQKIIQRYTENLAYLARILFSTRTLDSQAAAIAGDVDTYGFKKMVIALSNSGKIFGLSSFDGSLLWSSEYLGQPGPRSILLRKAYSREDESMHTQIVAIKEDTLTFMSASSGRPLFSQDLSKELRKGEKFERFMLISLKES